MHRFTDRVALVTGGASGIGAAVVKRLTSEGARVYSLDIRPPGNEDDGRHLVSDVSDFESISGAVDVVVAREHRLDMVVANAGVSAVGTVEDTSPEELDRLIAVNLRGVFFTLKAVLPVMRRQRHGAIVVMGSEQAIVGKARSAAYSATKGAVAQLARSTALDYAAHNVRVNCVCPGMTDTPALHDAFAELADRSGSGDARILFAAAKNRIPARRIGRPEEVAALVAFLCSDDAQYLTGAVVPIDGGYVARAAPGCG